MAETFLNKKLIYKQGLTFETVEKLEALHRALEDVIESPSSYEDAVFEIEQLEFKMQELWGFTQDRNYHAHWLRIKGCTCPKLDNKDRLGTPYRVLSKDCPWHGKGE